VRRSRADEERGFPLAELDKMNVDDER